MCYFFILWAKYLWDGFPLLYMLFVIQSYVLAPGIFGLCLYQMGDCMFTLGQGKAISHIYFRIVAFWQASLFNFFSYMAYPQ